MVKSSTIADRPEQFLSRRVAERINAVVGLIISPRVARLIAESDRLGESGDARRDRIRAEFIKK